MTSDEDKDKMDQRPDEAGEPGGVYQAQGPLSFEMVWLMFRETDKKIQETDRLLKEQSRETDKKIQETDRLLKEQSRETDKRLQETDRLLKEQSRETDRLLKEQSLAAARRSKELKNRIKETDRIFRKLSRYAGGLGNNIGEVAEDYFRGALGGLPEVAGFRIQKVDSLSRRVGDLSGQFDIVLLCEGVNVVVEVKHKLQLTDVIRFHKRTLPAFKQLYPEHCRKRVFGAVAGMSVDDAALAQALDLGFLVFTQSGQEVRVLNPSGFTPRDI